MLQTITIRIRNCAFGLALLLAGAAYGQSAPVMIDFSGVPANAQPTQSQLNASILGTPGDGSFTGGSNTANMIVVTATNSPCFPASTLIGGTPQMGCGNKVLQWTAATNPPPGGNFQFRFRTGAKATISEGHFFCADFDLSVKGGQYSNHQINGGNNTEVNTVLGPNPQPGGLAIENNFNGSSGVLAYHGGNCLTDSTLSAWRWITLKFNTGAPGQMQVWTADITTMLFSITANGGGNGVAASPGSLEFGISGGENECASGCHLYWKDAMVDDVTAVYPLKPATTGLSITASPTFSPVAGTYTSSQSVTISSTTSGATGCYTTDGSTPTANGSGTCTHGTKFTSAVTVSSDQTLKAIESKSGLTDSSVVSAAYVINAGSAGFGWAGIIAPARATDWTTNGVIGGIPSASYTQCGSTIAAYSGAPTTITNQLATCSANQFVLLGPGTFTLNNQIVWPQKSNLALRGSGAPLTKLIFTGGGGTLIAVTGTSGTTAFTEWTAGYAQGTNQITVASAAGCTSGQCVAILDQCEDSFSGDTCSTGSSADNGNFFNCSVIYAGGGVGCSSDGPDGAQTFRWQQERSLVTNVSGNVLTLQDKIRHPNWAAARTPHVTFQTSPLQFVGIENMALDGAAAGLSGSPSSVALRVVANAWIKGVEVTNSQEHCLGASLSSHVTKEQNYCAGAGTNVAHCVASAQVAKDLTQNNICIGFSPAIHTEQANDSSVMGYNFILSGNAGGYLNDDIAEAFREHSNGAAYELWEGNVARVWRSDITHGSEPAQTTLRNFFTGWDSCATGLCGGSQNKDFETNALIIDAFGRDHNHIGNVLGTPGYHTVYRSDASVSNAVMLVGEGNGNAPHDALVDASVLLWGNYDTVTGAVRWDVTEVPTGAPVYPNAVPTLGNVAAGQGPLPASFYLTSKPSWFGSIPFPPIGPDVTGGNIGQCGGTFNVSGQYNGLPATSNAQCGNHGITTAWGGHANAIPAMYCYLVVMGGTPDGKNPPTNFDPNACYGGQVVQNGGVPTAPSNLKATSSQ
jgi:hypothetical protein